MFWFLLDQDYYGVVGKYHFYFDIYCNAIFVRGILLENNFDPVYLFKLESKYRYSGTLYNKLNHLLTYSYRNVSYTLSGSTDSKTTDILYYGRYSLDKFSMNLKLISIEYINIIDINNLNYKSISKSLYFVGY